MGGWTIVTGWTKDERRVCDGDLTGPLMMVRQDGQENEKWATMDQDVHRHMK